MPSTGGAQLTTSSPNSKRATKMSSNQSLNHLLNFTLPPRQVHTSVPRRSSRKTNESTAYGVHNTERYINAQYRFILKPSGDYTVHFADPDIFFHWHDILEVIIPRPSAIVGTHPHGDEALMTCPICLSPPTAPRMTKCGHVFCFPCVLHYLNVSDNGKWIRCPICLDSVNEKQLKSVRWSGGDANADEREFPRDEQGVFPSTSAPSKFLRMRLMQRPQLTTLALPRSTTWPSELIPPHQAPFHFLPDVLSFSKFMLATPAYLVANLKSDLDDLEAERRVLSSISDDLSLVFIAVAEERIRLQIQEAQMMDTESLERSIDNAQRGLADIQRRQETGNRANQEKSEAACAREDIPDEMLSLTPLGNHAIPSNVTSRTRSRRKVNPPPPSTSAYYYYQSATGNPIFLHPLDIRILLSHCQSYAEFPDEITIKVEAFSEGAVNADLRKRCKYLALPEGADVVFVEAELESIVGVESLKNFDGALKTRRAKRKEKGRKDDRAKLRAEEKEREEQEKIYGPPQFIPPEALEDGHYREQIPPMPEAEVDATHTPPTRQAQTTGAWGSRSFASALHATPSAPSLPRGRRRNNELQDEFDVDLAWHELEQRNGRRKKEPKQKILVSGGGPAVRRR